MKNCFDIQNYDSQVMRLGPPIRKQPGVKVATSLRDFEVMTDRPVLTCADITRESLRILGHHLEYRKDDAVFTFNFILNEWKCS